jgi:hypothetical protein
VKIESGLKNEHFGRDRRHGHTRRDGHGNGEYRDKSIILSVIVTMIMGMFNMVCWLWSRRVHFTN